MCTTSFNAWRKSLLILLLTLLTGCGLTQRIAESTATATHTLFHQQITVLHLDFAAREAVNTDRHETGNWSVPVLVRICQLKQRQTFDTLTYTDVLTTGDLRLKNDLLGCREVTVRPGGGASLNVPMEKESQFVAVIGLFRDPDLQNNSWRIVLERDMLNPDRARVIELEQGSLHLLPEKEK
ncbi:type VI secretion system lipoprotein TssJ [Enterobacteriaceae bacterium LUAb1]